MSRRGKVWCVEQQTKENRKFVKGVMRTITPSKRTRRNLTKSMISSLSSHPQKHSVRKGRKVYGPPPLNSEFINQNKKNGRDETITFLVIVIGFASLYVILRYLVNTIFASDSVISENLIFALIAFSLIVLFLIVKHVKSKRLPHNVSEPEKNCGQTPEDLSNEFTGMDQINAKVFMDEFKDSLNIMQNTASPETFFSRYDLVMERLDNMIELQQKGIKFTSDLSSLKAQALSQETTADTVNVLIDNAYTKQLQKLSALKTERGRANSNQRWYASFEPYFDKMPARSRSYLDLKLEELKEV